MSNYWYCSTCNTRNHDNFSYCGQCCGDLPEKLEELESQNTKLRADLDVAIEALKDARGVIYTANQHLLSTYKDDYLSHQNQNNPVNRIDETLAKLIGEK